jgi:multidrug efflux pump subunit AcrA (membrane-fusion protein)
LAIGLSSGTAEATDNRDDVRILPVKVAPATFVTSINQKRKYTGTIRAKQQAALGFELTGRVLSVACDEGDVVAKGQLLATLDTKALVAKGATIEASLRQAEAALSELNAGPRQQTIDSMKAQLAEAESNLKLAEITLRRRTRLHRQRGTIEIQPTRDRHSNRKK